MKAKRSTIPLPSPVSASGKKLVIGNVELKDCSIVASSINGSNPIAGPTDGINWTVSQADLFRGRLNVSSLLEGVDEGEKVVFNASNDDLDVLVKVSSTIAHGLLIHPTLAFLALNSVKGVKELQRILYASILMGSGLITIMRDLSINEEGYKILRPEEFEGRKLLFLWQAYKTLVADILIPMASHSVVHPDIRPGFDITANILCKDCVEAKPLLLLIDFESLVNHRQWVCPDYDMYISCEKEWNAMTFVLWQSVAVAYAWHGRFSQRDINVRLVFPKDNKMHWLPEHILQEQFLFCHHHPDKVNELTVMEALSALDALFVGQLPE